MLVGAQVYENQQATYAEINEVLSLWKMRHVEFMTAKDDQKNPVSYWLRRRQLHSSTDVHSYHFLKHSNGVYGFDSAKLSRYAVKTELRRLWHRLKIGEGKAENQNNMITALMGEVVNILDMNQVPSCTAPPPPLSPVHSPAPPPPRPSLPQPPHSL